MIDAPPSDPLVEPIGWRHKAFPEWFAGVRTADLRAKGLNLLRGDLFLPAMVLKQDALEHNIRLMADWCRRQGVSLAPHGKTTMAPQIFRRQLEAGAWAITAASAGQAQAMRAVGVRRVIIANEVIDEASLRWLASAQDGDPTFEVFCLVDSIAGVALMDAALTQARAARPLQVLVELGATGTRAGARVDETACAVGEAVMASERMRLAGVECFEGVIGDNRGPLTLVRVDGLLVRLGEVARELDGLGCFAQTDEILLSAGGSVFFDRAAELCAVGGLSRPVRVVLRSGCYVTHDNGTYEAASPFGVTASPLAERLRSALELWSIVLSRPEPELAILGFGKRDAPDDAGMPVPLRVVSSGGDLRPIAGDAKIVSLNDQHAYMRWQQNAVLEIGDRVVCGISHPCTAFDKWSLLPVVDERYDIVDAVATTF